MGVPLVRLLQSRGNEVHVTTRQERKAEEGIQGMPGKQPQFLGGRNPKDEAFSKGLDMAFSKEKDILPIRYMTGDAHEAGFIKSVLENGYDAVVDFMVYGSEEFRDRLPLLLGSTGQYLFFSSARVYARSADPLREESPRLLDVCGDRQYLETDEYALAKAREENMLRESCRNNWTIIRPYITYNSRRLQLGVYEKENWLWRALQGRTIVFPRDIAERMTTMTYGPDVAAGVAELIGNPKGLGQIFHITTGEHATWEEILEIYLEVIEERTGVQPKVLMTEDSVGLGRVWNEAQIRYDRLYDRVFDGTKLARVCRNMEFKDLRSGLRECLNAFLEEPEWFGINWRYEAWADRRAGERTRIGDIVGKRNKLGYVKRRYFYTHHQPSWWLSK